MQVFLLVFTSYLFGAVPFGVLAARSQGVDLSSVGSGNVGATNVHRALGWRWSLLVFALDVCKGLGPALLARQVLRDHVVEWSFVVGLAAISGHCASPFLRFKGGKGVATGLGAILASTPLVACGALSVFLVMMFAFQWVSLASLAAAVSLIPFDLMFKVPPPVMAAHAALALFLIYRHRSNIRRIRNREEPKFKWKK
jgi:glycerol-3-phosphate acyltransferase PlsY